MQRVRLGGLGVTPALKIRLHPVRDLLTYTFKRRKMRHIGIKRRGRGRGDGGGVQISMLAFNSVEDKGERSFNISKSAARY